jgi:hypothetical protein
MKKIFSICLILAVTAGTMPSCKKGENDPFLSLHSRRARIAGEWKVTGFVSDDSYKTGTNDQTIHETLSDGMLTSTFTITQSGTVTASQTWSQAFTQSLNLRRDGTYTETKTVDGQQTTYKGTWIFLKKNKPNKLRNKEAILLTRQEMTTPDNPSYNTNTIDGIVYRIDLLKNKKMVWKTEDISSNSANTFSDTSEITFEQG